jgi:hypothetical protein
MLLIAALSVRGKHLTRAVFVRDLHNTVAPAGDFVSLRVIRDKAGVGIRLRSLWLPILPLCSFTSGGRRTRVTCSGIGPGMQLLLNARSTVSGSTQML